MSTGGMEALPTGARCQELILEVLKVETCLKEVWKPKEGLANISSKSNPTVEANICLWNVFEQDLQQNR